MPDDDFDLDDSDESPEDSSVIKGLRKEARRAKDLDTEAKALRQEVAILKSGITLTPLQTKALLAAHEGDFEPEALRKTATELGFPVAAPAEAIETPQVPADEQAAHQRMQEATAGAVPSDAETPTLEARMREAAAKGEAALDAFLAGEGIGVNAEQ